MKKSRKIEAQKKKAAKRERAIKEREREIEEETRIIEEEKRQRSYRWDFNEKIKINLIFLINKKFFLGGTRWLAWQ